MSEIFKEVKDSGVRQNFETGSVRDTDEGKGNPCLVPTYPLRRLAVHYQNGAVKYKRNNWRKGQPISRYYDSAQRHLWAFAEGDTSEDHLAAAMWNICSIIQTQKDVEDGYLDESMNDFPFNLEDLF